MPVPRGLKAPVPLTSVALIPVPKSDSGGEQLSFVVCIIDRKSLEVQNISFRIQSLGLGVLELDEAQIYVGGEKKIPGCC